MCDRLGVDSRRVRVSGEQPSWASFWVLATADRGLVCIKVDVACHVDSETDGEADQGSQHRDTTEEDS